MEAKRVAEEVGAVIGLAILLTRLTLHRGDSPSKPRDTSFRQHELPFSQAEGFREAEDEAPGWEEDDSCTLEM